MFPQRCCCSLAPGGILRNLCLQAFRHFLQRRGRLTIEVGRELVQDLLKQRFLSRRHFCRGRAQLLADRFQPFMQAAGKRLGAPGFGFLHALGKAGCRCGHILAQCRKRRFTGLIHTRGMFVEQLAQHRHRFTGSKRRIEPVDQKRQVAQLGPAQFHHHPRQPVNGQPGRTDQRAGQQPHGIATGIGKRAAAKTDGQKKQRQRAHDIGKNRPQHQNLSGQQIGGRAGGVNTAGPPERTHGDFPHTRDMILQCIGEDLGIDGGEQILRLNAFPLFLMPDQPA